MYNILPANSICRQISLSVDSVKSGEEFLSWLRTKGLPIQTKREPFSDANWALIPYWRKSAYATCNWLWRKIYRPERTVKWTVKRNWIHVAVAHLSLKKVEFFQVWSSLAICYTKATRLDRSVLNVPYDLPSSSSCSTGSRFSSLTTIWLAAILFQIHERGNLTSSVKTWITKRYQSRKPGIFLSRSIGENIFTCEFNVASSSTLHQIYWCPFTTTV